MWGILIAIIIIVIIFMLNPLKFTDLSPSTKPAKKVQTEVNRVVNESQSQVDYARQMQQSEQENNNNN